MTEINLREQVPDFYKADYIIAVPDEVAAILMEYDRGEAAYRKRVSYHRAYYSLDRGDGIEREAVFLSMSPDEIYERKVTMLQLHAALVSLPDKQAKRIYAYCFLGLSMKDIARNERVSVEAVSNSIRRGLCNLKKRLKY